MEKIESIIFKLLGGTKIEQKLIRCQSYRPNSVPKFKAQTNLNWLETVKLLNSIEVFDAQRIRSVIHEIVQNNSEVFDAENLYITSFGSEGKSGGKIAYEFRHTNLFGNQKFVSSWELSKLPEGSTIIFVEDLIGTGTQSTEFILNKLNLVINPSHKPYLLTICATSEGIQKVSNETNFKVINGIELRSDNFQHYSTDCKTFTDKLKTKLIELNGRLKKQGSLDYDRGLLVSFFYSPPNNSMPIIWKEGYPYLDKKGKEKKWFALIPRQY
jgi:hypothetical protein